MVLFGIDVEWLLLYSLSVGEPRQGEEGIGNTRKHLESGSR